MHEGMLELERISLLMLDYSLGLQLSQVFLDLDPLDWPSLLGVEVGLNQEGVSAQINKLEIINTSCPGRYSLESRSKAKDVCFSFLSTSLLIIPLALISLC